MKNNGGAEWVLMILLFVISGIICFGKHNAHEYVLWKEEDTLARDNLNLMQHRYEDAKSMYDSCVNMDWDSAATTSNECDTAKAELDDAHKKRELARGQVRSLSSAPSVYFNGFFLKASNEDPSYLR